MINSSIVLFGFRFDAAVFRTSFLIQRKMFATVGLPRAAPPILRKMSGSNRSRERQQTSRIETDSQGSAMKVREVIAAVFIVRRIRACANDQFRKRRGSSGL
jgi:hypothetical protein